MRRWRLVASGATSVFFASWFLCPLQAQASAQADTRGSTITLAGSRSFWVPLDLSRATRWNAIATSVTLRGAAPFGGYYLATANGGPASGAISAKALNFTFLPFTLPTPLVSQVTVLRAGHYRLYLLANGPTRVRIPVAGLVRSVTFAHGYPGEVSGFSYSTSLHSIVPISYRATKIWVSPGVFVFVASHQEERMGQLTYVNTCIQSQPRPCIQHSEPYVSIGAAASGGTAARSYAANSLPPGPYYAVTQGAGAGTLTKAMGFVLEIRQGRLFR